MKASELRIGIWVYLFGDAVQLTKDHLIYLLQKDGLPEPITLTPEWLEKFGFENHKLILPYNGAFQSYLIAQLGDSRIQICKNGYYAYDPEVRYVHQLQNLYFALTGEELTSSSRIMEGK